MAVGSGYMKTRHEEYTWEWYTSIAPVLRKRGRRIRSSSRPWLHTSLRPAWARWGSYLKTNSNKTFTLWNCCISRYNICLADVKNKFLFHILKFWSLDPKALPKPEVLCFLLGVIYLMVPLSCFSWDLLRQTRQGYFCCISRILGTRWLLRWHTLLVSLMTWVPSLEPIDGRRVLTLENYLRTSIQVPWLVCNPPILKRNKCKKKIFKFPGPKVTQ